MRLWFNPTPPGFFEGDAAWEDGRVGGGGGGGGGGGESARGL